MPKKHECTAKKTRYNPQLLRTQRVTDSQTDYDDKVITKCVKKERRLSWDTN